MGGLVARGWPVVALVAAWPGRAGAEDAPRVDVTWHGPESCPRGRFDDALARHLAESEVGPVEVSAEVGEQQGRWQLVATLAMGGESFAPRTFSARSCEAVVDAAALAAAIAIDPLHVADEPASSSAEPPEATTAAPTRTIEIAAPTEAVTSSSTRPPVQRREPAPRTNRSRRTSPTRGFVSIAAALDGGALPGLGAGLGAGLGLVRKRLRLELVGGWRAPVRVRSVDDASIGARIDLFTIGARACGVVRPARRIELPLCAGLESGMVRGRGFGLEPDATARLLWLAAVASGGVTWVANDHFALFGRAELGVPLVLHEFAIARLDTIDRVAPVLGRGLFGLEVRFP